MASGSNVDLVLAASFLSSSLATFSCGSATVRAALVLLSECFCAPPFADRLRRSSCQRCRGPVCAAADFYAVAASLLPRPHVFIGKLHF
jgi:hypothetical protein